MYWRVYAPAAVSELYCNLDAAYIYVEVDSVPGNGTVLCFPDTTTAIDRQLSAAQVSVAQLSTQL